MTYSDLRQGNLIVDDYFKQEIRIFKSSGMAFYDSEQEYWRRNLNTVTQQIITFGQ